ncbi:MAG: NfeD family protein [Lachnospiraceae bacterium]|nr:NfeD family protein [Lachnospiraceae bacterium]
MWWLCAFVVFLLAEIASVALTSIWFSVGALAAFVVSLYCDILWVQILVFLLVSLVLVIVTRPVADKFLNRDRAKTNVDAIVGRQGIVTEDIDDLKATGEVSLAGQIWMARTGVEGRRIEKDAKVVVREIRGVKLIVEEKKEETR